MNAWNADTEAGPSEAGAVTVVEGSSFCISSHNGDIIPRRLTRGLLPGHPGSFPLDAPGQRRPSASRWWPRRPGAFQATFVGRARWPDGRFDSPLVVRHQRHIGPGLRDDITLSNYSSEPADCDIELSVDADHGRPLRRQGRQGAHRCQLPAGAVQGAELHIEAERNGQRRGAAIRAAGAAGPRGCTGFPGGDSGPGTMVHQRHCGSADQWGGAG